MSKFGKIRALPLFFLHFFLALATILASTAAHAVTYANPTSIGCTLASGTTYNCSAISLGTSTNFSSSTLYTLNIAGDFTASTNVQLGTSSNRVNIIASGNITIDNNVKIYGNLTANSGTITLANSNNTDVFGDISAESINMGNNASVSGNCTYVSSCTGNCSSNCGSTTVIKANQTITFGAQTSPRTYSSGGIFPISPTATASSGLTVTYSSTTTSVCTISGTTVTMVAAGTCTIAANQDGNASYNPAPQVTQNVTIDKANQTITFGAQTSPLIYSVGGTFTLNPTATASSGLTVTYTSTTTSVCTISGTTVTMLATGTCTIAANQAGNSNYNAAPQVAQSVTINAGSPTMSLANASVVEGNISGTTTALSIPVTLTAASGSNSSATYTLSNGTATGGGACSAGVDFINTGGTITIAAGTTTGSIPVPICGDTTYEGDESFTVTLTTPVVNAILGTSTATGTILNDDAPPLVAEYRFDETTWNGTTGEVKDSSGNGRDATATLAITATGTPGPAYSSGTQSTCRYGVFDGGSISKSYVQLPNSFPGLSGSFSLTAWINSTNATAQHQRIFVRDDNQDGWALSLADNTGTGILRFFNRSVTFNSPSGGVVSAGGVAIDTTFTLSSNTWYFVGLTVDTVGKTVVMYAYDANGVQRAKMSASFTGTWGAGTGATAIGGETAASSEGQQTSWHFLGRIDEVRIYSGALTQTLVEALLPTTRSCNCVLGSFRITQDATALACPDTRALISVEPLCTDGTTVKNDYAGTVTLGVTPSNASAAFYTAASGGSALSPSTVTFVAGDLTKSAYLYYPNEASACVVASDGGVSTTSASCTSFHAYGFRVSTQPADFACGSTSTVTLTAYGKNESGTGCSAITGFSGNKNLKAWFTSGIDTNNPAITQASNRTLAITGSASGITDNTEPAAANLSNVNFSNGAATLTVGYPNAAKILGLNFKHNDAPYTSATCTATSFCPLEAQTSAFLVYPNSFALSVTDGGSACAAGNASCAAFKAAGDTFNMKLQALCLDGTTLATDYKNGSSAIPLTVEVIAPSPPPDAANGASGSVGTTTTHITSAGYQDFTQTWSEVGVAKFSAAPPSWFGHSFTPVVTGNIGRFYPDHFTLNNGSTVVAATGTGGFTYMSQPAIAITANLQARAKGSANGVGGTGTLTTNYHNFGTNLNFAPGTVSFVAENADDGVERWSGPPARMTATVPAAWNRGEYIINATDGMFARLASGPDGSFENLQFGAKISANDTPTILLENLTMNAAAVTCGSGCNAVTVGLPTRVRFGRLRLTNTFGSVSPLKMPLETQYWTGKSWIRNMDDSGAAGTSLASVPFSYSTTGWPAPTVPATLSNGEAFITINPTNADRKIISADLSGVPWLKSKWGGTTYDQSPSATATFGIYAPEHKKTIHIREIY